MAPCLLLSSIFHLEQARSRCGYVNYHHHHWAHVYLHLYHLHHRHLLLLHFSSYNHLVLFWPNGACSVNRGWSSHCLSKEKLFKVQTRCLKRYFFHRINIGLYLIFCVFCWSLKWDYREIMNLESVTFNYQMKGTQET